MGWRDTNIQIIGTEYRNSGSYLPTINPTPTIKNENSSGPSIDEKGDQLETNVDVSPSSAGVVNAVGDTTIETQDIVQMDNNAGVVVNAVQSPLPMHHSLLKNMVGDLDHSIKSFLSRPYNIYSGSITTSDVQNTEKHALYLFSDLFSGRTYYKEKLHGVTGFRATTHYRVQTNANRFQQGRLMVTFFPGSGDCSVHASKSLSMVLRSQLPRTELDINVCNEATLVVPYVNTVPYYLFLRPGDSFLGHIATSVYSPLYTGSGGENEYDFSIWVHFTDVELFWPGDTLPQSGSSGGRVKNRKLIELEVPSKDRPVSYALNTISAAANALARIPLLSSYVAPIAWASAIGAKVATSFGYCKPNSNSKDVLVLRQTQGWANGTGRNLGENLGLFEDNKVVVMSDIGGSGVDQMSLKYVLRIPTYYDTFSFPTTSGPGTLLVSYNVRPQDFRVQLADNVFAPTPLNYFSRMFAFYRGGITLRIKAVKTEFHTGRLRVIVSNAGTPNDLAYSISKIIDLKEASEWTFDVPYMAPSLYSPCNSPDVWPVLQFYVLNELRAPETAASVVKFLVEVCGGNDFEFANPVTPANTRISVSRLPSNLPPTDYGNPVFGNNPGITFHAQDGSGDLEEDSHTLEGDFPLANVPIFPPSLDPSLMCIGERITTLKQLATRPSYYLTTSNASFAFNVDYIDANLDMNAVQPFRRLCTDIGTASFLNLIRMCYAFNRGSINVKVSNLESAPCVSMWNAIVVSKVPNTTGTATMAMSFISTVGSACNNQPLFANRSIPNGFQYVTINQGVADVTLPNYSLNPVRKNNWLFDNAPSFGDLYCIQRDARIVRFTSRLASAAATVNDYSPGNLYDVYVSGGDDFQCGFFIGCPIYQTTTHMTTFTADTDNNYSRIQSFPQVYRPNQ